MKQNLQHSRVKLPPNKKSIPSQPFYSVWRCSQDFSDCKVWEIFPHNLLCRMCSTTAKKFIQREQDVAYDVPEAGDQIQTRGKGNLQEGNSSVSGMGNKSNCSSVTQETDTWRLSSLRAHATAPSFSLMTEWVGRKPYPISYLYVACLAFSSTYCFQIN